MRAGSLCCAGVAAALLWCLGAAADPAPSGASDYTVNTVDGSIYRGQLVESVVGSHVTLRLATGAVRRFEAGDILNQGPAPAAPPSAAPGEMRTLTPQPAPYTSNVLLGPSFMYSGPLGRAGAPLAYDGPGAVHVHIQGAGQLYQESPNGWQPVCNVPCTTTVDPKGNYKVGGFLFRDSRTFRFDGGSPSMELVAKPHSSFGFGRSMAGWTLISLGAAFAVPGVLFLGGTFNDSTSPSSNNTVDTALGVGFVGAAALCLGLGIYFLATPSGTVVETLDGTRIAKQRRRPALSALEVKPWGLVF